MERRGVSRSTSRPKKTKTLAELTRKRKPKPKVDMTQDEKHRIREEHERKLAGEATSSSLESSSSSEPQERTTSEGLIREVRRTTDTDAEAAKYKVRPPPLSIPLHSMGQLREPQLSPYSSASSSSSASSHPANRSNALTSGATSTNDITNAAINTSNIDIDNMTEDQMFSFEREDALPRPSIKHKAMSRETAWNNMSYEQLVETANEYLIPIYQNSTKSSIIRSLEEYRKSIILVDEDQRRLNGEPTTIAAPAVPKTPYQAELDNEQKGMIRYNGYKDEFGEDLLRSIRRK